MRINTKVIIDIAENRIVKRETFEYDGRVAEALSFGGNKSNQKQQSQQQSTSQTGTAFNPDFFSDFFANLGGGKRTITSQSVSDQLAPLEAEYNAIPEGRDRGYPYAQQLAAKIARLRSQKESVDQQGGQVTTGVPEYNPQYVKSDFTSVAPQGFQRLEDVLFGGQSAKLGQAYNTQVNQQREQLAQTGALNDPAQFLEGSARSSLDRTYQQNLQQAARDAAQQRLGAETTEAARRTQYGQTEAGRETTFNQQAQAAQLERFFKLLQAAIESGRFSTGESGGWSTGSGSNIGGNFGFLSSSSSPSTDMNSWMS